MKSGNVETLDLLVCVIGLLTFGLYFLFRGIWNVCASKEESTHYAEKDTCAKEEDADRKIGAFFVRM